MSEALRKIAWPGTRLGEALSALGKAGKLDALQGLDNPSPELPTQARFHWASEAATSMGVEPEELRCSLRELETTLPLLGPALVPLSLPGEETRFLAILESRGKLTFIGPDGTLHRRPSASVAHALSAPIYRALAQRGVPSMLEAAGIPEPRQHQVLQTLAKGRHGEASVGPFLTLRPHPASSLSVLSKHAGLPRLGALVLATHVLSTLAALFAWYLIGRGALSGRWETGWLVAWSLALLSAVPLTVTANHAQGKFAVRAGRLMKQRVLHGLLNLPPDATREDGTGKHLSRILESSAIEALFIGGSLASVLSVVDMVTAAMVLSMGVASQVVLAALVVYVGLAAALTRRLYVRRQTWTRQRLAMTHDLVERMVGHRTRLAQQDPSRWHDDEDAMLESYFEKSQDLDATSVQLSLVSRGWLVLGALAVAPAFIAGADAATMGVTIGGILLGSQALAALSGGLGQLTAAAVAWEQVKPLMDAANVESPKGELELRLDAAPTDSTRPILSASELSYRYEGQDRSALKACTLAVSHGDRILIEGPSGSGKSTLAMVLGGLREASSGLLLVDGLDLNSLGSDEWRRRVVTVPQFHQNHVFSGTLAFNALMGREWPPSNEDLAELHEICMELGLGPVLERMPAQLHQTVGEQGWQLSHGERSRLFLARALAMKTARVWILDESFAALDPITLDRCVRAVVRRAPALVVIAHP
ncbi:MAG: ABC transporter ATP-binding protein [Proteobacteria bacterium]|nr:ABC transporter ATP-binding protein [Pseudomonadota bacterium]